MGNYTTRRDAKGRLSVPAAFRAVLRDGAADGAMNLVLRASHQHACIEAWPEQTFQELGGGFDRLEHFSSDEEDLTTALYADAWPVEPDKEGRMIVPESLVRHAGLTDTVFFFGRKQLFQIWEPAAGERRIAEARQNAAARRLTLPAAR